MNESLARLCAAHGIEPRYFGLDGVEHQVPESTLFALAEAFDIADSSAPPPPGIDAVRGEASPPRCHIPEALIEGRAWGITCQLPGLVSARNHGVGDFADLAALCRIAAAEGADFVGVNPLHALFWSDPGRVSPFFPSNRRFLNPLHIALDWVPGFGGLTADEQETTRIGRAGDLLDLAAVTKLKDRVLRRLFAAFPKEGSDRTAFRAFCEAGRATLEAHAVFEAISEAMVAAGRGPTPVEWPDLLRHHDSPQVAAFAAHNRDAVDYHLWLQWLAHGQLQRTQDEARAAGMRIGLYLDCAVGAAPDGSAAWSDPATTVPDLSIGAPPDFFNAGGQDWGLAPLSPLGLAAHDGGALAEDLAAVMRTCGAVRVDHAMSLARLWLIPRGASPTDGAYVRYPLSLLLRRLAEISQATDTLVIGEDLGVVPQGFRELMGERGLHRTLIFLFERGEHGYHDPAHWPRDAIACVATHDMPSFARWWRGGDLGIGESLGILNTDPRTARDHRMRDRQAMLARLDLPDEAAEDAAFVSARLHAKIAESPCRLAALQIEDALALDTQVNIPGTVAQYPNWLRRVPVAVEDLAQDRNFQAHTAAMHDARPR